MDVCYCSTSAKARLCIIFCLWMATHVIFDDTRLSTDVCQLLFKPEFDDPIFSFSFACSKLVSVCRRTLIFSLPHDIGFIGVFVVFRFGFIHWRYHWKQAAMCCDGDVKRIGDGKLWLLIYFFSSSLLLLLLRSFCCFTCVYEVEVFYLTLLSISIGFAIIHSIRYSHWHGLKFIFCDFLSN